MPKVEERRGKYKRQVVAKKIDVYVKHINCNTCCICGKPISYLSIAPEMYRFKRETKVRGKTVNLCYCGWTCFRSDPNFNISKSEVFEIDDD